MSETSLAQAVKKHLDFMEKERLRLAADIPDQVVEELSCALRDYQGADYDACLQQDEDHAILDCGCILGRLSLGEPYIKFCTHHKPPEILRPTPSDTEARRGR